MFAQRAQGFQIEFRFRNAPPRPPVGPCFVGHSLDSVLLEQCRQYKPLDAVEVNHTWKLHSEPDIGVPLAPSAMDRKSYERPDENAIVSIHPEDEALLNWTGSMGDTAADDLKRRQEQARVAARLAMSGRSPDAAAAKTVPAGHVERVQKKVFTRMLNETMKPWMKKTVYLSNDYSRKVHDFKSLAQTKSELASELQIKQDEMAIRRTVKAISNSFDFPKEIMHPTNKQLKSVRVMQVLPDASNWGRAFTHVVVDKAPISLPTGHTVEELDRVFVTNVEKRQANARMTCTMIAPAKDLNDNDVESDKKDFHRPIQAFDLDVIPLKEEDMPHVNFCLWIDGDIARYIPVASRVQLSMGRPSKISTAYRVVRREMTDKEITEMEERMAEVDQDLAEKHHISKEDRPPVGKQPSPTLMKDKSAMNDDGEDDFGDDESDEEEVFGGGRKTIVADS
jgi:hypothetical protein